MERSERSSTGKAAGTPAAPAHGAPGRGSALGDAGAAPPVDPDDDQDGDAVAAAAEGAGSVRAEPWEPDAGLMRALGLELDELRPRLDADEPDRSDEPPRPAPVASRPAASEASLAGSSDSGEPRPTTSDGRPPWW